MAAIANRERSFTPYRIKDSQLTFVDPQRTIKNMTNLAAKNNPIYQLADSLTEEQIKLELSTARGKYADLCRKALGYQTSCATTLTAYGCRIEIARRLIKLVSIWA